MTFHRRRLPHLHATNHPIFLTWRLFGSLPNHKAIPPASATSGAAFAKVDRLLDETRIGPYYLREPLIAQMIIECFKHYSNVLGHCQIHAFAIMPNHVHLLLTSQVPITQLVKSIKGYTARQANVILGRTGEPFWQRETYDHVVRNSEGFERIKRYIEMNPVRAGLVSDPADYKYSSASAVLVALGG